jgi:hypothetical protein
MTKLVLRRDRGSPVVAQGTRARARSVHVIEQDLSLHRAQSVLSPAARRVTAASARPVGGQHCVRSRLRASAEVARPPTAAASSSPQVRGVTHVRVLAVTFLRLLDSRRHLRPGAARRRARGLSALSWGDSQTTCLCTRHESTSLRPQRSSPLRFLVSPAGGFGTQTLCRGPSLASTFRRADPASCCRGRATECR